MDSVANCVGQNLDLNMPRAFQKAFDEDCTVSESRLGFGDCTFERILEIRLFAHDTHTTATSAHCSLDDNYERKEIIHIEEHARDLGPTWEAIFFDERLSVDIRRDRSWCSGNDRYTDFHG